ncbi:hypothetical protein H5410_001154 [Solanum commersonii]|uniref:Gag-pol polyprotein n=1 Tax=Solanum commersonii TaxID=4109 RepID=A0A9J6AXV5_SOLCO|nr:hypothetical protein H5410_001154 [Solanum commersonii]
MADLVELDMVEFDVILGMEWLQACYASIDCRTRVVQIPFSSEPVIELKSSSAMPKDKLRKKMNGRAIPITSLQHGRTYNPRSYHPARPVMRDCIHREFKVGIGRNQLYGGFLKALKTCV